MMNLEKELESLTYSKNSFSTGFILGIFFAILALFFLVTKTGKELAEKIKSSDFNWEKLDEFLADELKNFSHEAENFPNGDNNSANKLSQTPLGTKPTTSALGRRFFRQRK